MLREIRAMSEYEIYTIVMLKRLQLFIPEHFTYSYFCKEDVVMSER